MSFIESMTDKLIIEHALYPVNVLIFLILCTLFFISFGLLCNTKSCENAWKNIDLPYYILGAFGVFLLFQDSIDGFSIHALARIIHNAA